MFQILGSFAEFERNQLAENVKLGMKQKARKGQWNGGRIIGYDLVDEELKINNEERVIVQKIFWLIYPRKRTKKYANQLNHEGYKTKRSNPFSIQAVRDILHNLTYVGKIK